MRIFVFGNINTGKSYVVEHLRKMLKNYPILKIDEYRIKYGNGTYEGEILAQDKFVYDVSIAKDAIIEATGLGPLGDKLASTISYRNSIILKVEANLNVCLKRLEFKKFDLIPYPKVSETLENTIIRCHNEFKEQYLEKLWKNKVIDIITIDSLGSITEQFSQIPFNHYNRFSDIIDLFIENNDIESIISFGSLGRGELTKLSDIDLYVVTKLLVKDILRQIRLMTNDLWFTDYIGDKITLRFKEDNLLIEIIVLENLKDGEKYYLGSRIDDISKTIYKITEEDLTYIQEVDYKIKQNIKSDIDYLVKEMVYFILSLRNIIIKKDWYKYYFHNNIILHNYVRIKALLNGVEKFNYLPKNALDYINNDEIASLIYDLKLNNYINHKKNLIKQCINLFSLVDMKYKTNYVDEYQIVIGEIKYSDKVKTLVYSN